MIMALDSVSIPILVTYLCLNCFWYTSSNKSRDLWSLKNLYILMAFIIRGFNLKPFILLLIEVGALYLNNT